MHEHHQLLLTVFIPRNRPLVAGLAHFDQGIVLFEGIDEERVFSSRGWSFFNHEAVNAMVLRYLLLISASNRLLVGLAVLGHQQYLQLLPQLVDALVQKVQSFFELIHEIVSIQLRHRLLNFRHLLLVETFCRFF